MSPDIVPRYGGAGSVLFTPDTGTVNKLVISVLIPIGRPTMGNMLQRAKTILHTNEFTALYDKGYHTGSEFETADNLDIDVLAAIPTVAANAPDGL